jgi:signal transduction histidine kinase
VRKRGWHLLLGVVFSPVLSLSAAGAPGDTEGFPIDLQGLHKFSPGDDPRWESREYDDSRWKEIRVPGSWQSQGIKAEDGVGWYRIHFRVKTPPCEQDIGVLLGRIGDADEVFLNGRRIGGEGVIGRNFVEANLAERLYRAPRPLLLHERDNVLAVRVMNTYLEGGILESGAVIGSYDDLRLETIRRARVMERLEIILLTVYALFAFFGLLMIVSGVREREYLAFFIFALLYGVSYVLSSELFYEAGLKTHLVQKALFCLAALLPASLLLFLSEACRERLGVLAKSVMLIFLALAAAFLVSLDWRIYRLLVAAWTVMALITVGLALFLSVRAFRRKVPESGPLLGGMVILSMGTISWLLQLGGIVDIKDFHGHGPADLAMPLTMFCFVYAVDARFSRTLRSVKWFSEKIVVAHEEERKRLARELHDGLGQSLLTTKFNLQRLNQEKKEKGLDTAVGELSRSIDELREISAGLRPPFLEEMGLAAALRMYGNRLVEKTGLRVSVKAEPGARLTPLMEDNLFRIAQEALGNAAKHSQAKAVGVRLSRAGGSVIMEIWDDGCGFDYLRVRSQNRGIGLSTMEERASLVGGSLSVKSGDGKGTTVRVEAPFHDQSDGC